VKPSGGYIGATKTESKERERERERERKRERKREREKERERERKRKRDVSKGIRYGLVKRRKETKEKRKSAMARFVFNRCKRERRELT